MTRFLHNFHPSAVLFQLGPLTIHWYGVCILLGFLLGLFLVLRLARRYELNSQVIYDLCFYGLVFGLIGDRLYYVVYAWEYYSANPGDITKIWHGGLAIHGGIIAGTLVFLVYALRSSTFSQWKEWLVKKKIIPENNLVPERPLRLAYFWFLTDLCVVILLSGLMLGRFGNYFNQELFGTPTNLPWGIPIDLSERPLEYQAFSYFHPTFLYESLGDLVILLIVLSLHAKRLKKIAAAVRPETLLSGFGNITLLGLALYSAVRFFNEFLRVDYSPFVFGVRWAQIMSVLVIIVCVGLFFMKKNRLGFSS